MTGKSITTQALSKKGAALPPVPVKSRIAPKLRHAIKLRVEHGHTITEACRIAGIAESGWHKAMQRPAVIEHLEAIKLKYIADAQRNFQVYQAEAIETAATLMRTGETGNVRMRAVEFFKRETAQPAVNVQINNAPTGYSYARPAPQVIDAKAIPDPDHNI